MKTKSTVLSAWITAAVTGMVLIMATPGMVQAQVSYDTAWTLVYDGGKWPDSSVNNDVFKDVKVLSDGSSICVGQSFGSLLLIKYDATGKIVWKKLHEVLQQGGGEE